MARTEVKLYEIFSGHDLEVAEKIQQRRLQMLVHSYIYYEMDTNVISDHQWAAWANELAELQNTYPEISQQVPFRAGFEKWDASTGAFLPLKQDWIITKAYQLTGKRVPVIVKKPKVVKPAKPERKRLF